MNKKIITPKKDRPHYVDNKKFYSEIVKYKEACEKARQEGKQEPRLSNYIGECIYKIADKLSYKPCFMNYSFREEMVDDGIENCIMYFKDFDPNKTQNPFAYFTQVIYYAFLRRIAKEERNRYTTYKYFQETMINPGLAEISIDDTSSGTGGDYDNLIPKKMYDNITDFMDRFERKENEKKKKRKELKGLQKFYEGEENEGESKSAVTG